MKLAVVILAAGLGTRMKSSRPKVLHTLLGKPMLSHVLESTAGLKPDRTVVVVHPEQKDVHTLLKEHKVEMAIQQKMLGTADAVKTAFEKLRNFRGYIIVLNGDTPLIQKGTLEKFVGKFNRSKSDLAVLSFHAADPFSYGRVLRNAEGKPLAIVEQNDLSGREWEINEVNSGIYAFRKKTARYLDMITINRNKGEYYLTDIVRIANEKREKCNVFMFGDEYEFTGINTIKDLMVAERKMQSLVLEKLMSGGVRILDCSSVIIHDGVRINADTMIYPNVSIEGDTHIGRRCVIHQGSRIVDSAIATGVNVLAGSVIHSSTIGTGSAIGPYAHLRPGSRIGKDVKIGNFVEVKNSTISDGSKASHLSYIGDATIGKNVNIGAGTITCNYDGARKHRTIIEDGVFIGSDTQIIAPVRIGRNAFVAAGTTITKNVLPDSLAISRTGQQEIPGWARSKRKQRKK